MKKHPREYREYEPAAATDAIKILLFVLLLPAIPFIYIYRLFKPSKHTPTDDLT